MIVVTGATGNTGRVAVEALLASGEKVRVIGRDAKKLEPSHAEGRGSFRRQRGRRRADVEGV